MAFIAAYDDVKINRTQREVRGGYAWRTEFLNPAKGNTTDPHAFLAERSFGGGIRPHFHDVDQFQIFVSGDGAIGRHKAAHCLVHFARAHTPYGPITPTQEGVGFLTLRARRAGGMFHVPEYLEMLKAVPNRRPWQVSELPEFGGEGEVSIQALRNVRNDEGLAAHAIKLKPNARTAAPAPSGGAGQYLIVTKGGVVHNGKDHRGITIIFVKPDEPAFQLVAGSVGADVLALNFPKAHGSAVSRDAAPSSQRQFRVWQCLLCAFTYDEAKGMPEEGIAPGTRWEEVPDTWTCPDCSAAKNDFDMAVVS